MKEKVWKSLVLIGSVVLIVTVVLVSAGAASSSALEISGKSGNDGWSALEKVPRFLQEAEKAGFSYQEGMFSFLDLIKSTCEIPGYFCAMGNNPWPNAYFSLQMPNPPDANYQPPYGQLYQMEQDQAIVIIGQTPPRYAILASNPGCRPGLSWESPTRRTRPPIASSSALHSATR